jgi:hypothetical protein
MVMLTTMSQARSAAMGRKKTEASRSAATPNPNLHNRVPNSPTDRACTLSQAMLTAAAHIPATDTNAKPRSFENRRRSAAGTREEPRS